MELNDTERLHNRDENVGMEVGDENFHINNQILLEQNAMCENLPDSAGYVRWWLDAHQKDIDNNDKIVTIPASTIPEKNDKINDQESVNVQSIRKRLLEDSLSSNTDASEYSDATELETGDEEILVHRQMKVVTSSASVAKENTECDREFMFKMYQNLGKELKEMLIINQTQADNKYIENQETIKNAIEGVQIAMQSELGEIRCVKNDILQVKDELLSLQNGVKNNLSKIEKEVKNDLTAVRNEHKVDIDKILAQGQGMATEVIAKLTGLEGHCQLMVLKIDVCKEDVEVLQKDVALVQSDLLEEREARIRQNDDTNNKVDSLQAEMKESNIEMRSLNSNNDIQVRVIQTKIISLEKSLDKLKLVQNQCQENIDKLGEVVEANAVQGNVLNNHLHKIEGKIDKVGEVMPVLLQRTLLQTLGNIKAEIDTKNCNSPIPLGVPEEQLGQRASPLLDNQPSISSTPLLPEKFVTPPISRQFPPDVMGATPKERNVRSDHVIADIVKRDQKPYFCGDNVSPPIFIQEVENFYKLVKINDDKDRLQLFPSFLSGNPFEWWKLISHDVTTWELAKDLLLKQYFNDFERQKYKAEWRNLDCKDFSSVEEFTLRGLKILNTIKIKDSEQKKCERVTIKLPEPLRDYLLNKQFTSTQHFLNCIKDAMLLKNFNSSLYFKKQKTSNSTSGGSSNAIIYNNGKSNNQNVQYNDSHSNNQQNNNNSNKANLNNNSNHNGTNTPYQGMNPRYKGSPRNYIPNFRYNPNNGNGGNRTPPPLDLLQGDKTRETLHQIIKEMVWELKTITEIMGITVISDTIIEDKETRMLLLQVVQARVLG